MSAIASGKSSKGLTQESFDSLLGRLDADRAVAGQKYEQIRRRLIKVFEWSDCANPGDLADETINRVARKLKEGEDIRNLEPYFGAVARHVLQEHRREAKKEPTSLEALILSQGLAKDTGGLGGVSEEQRWEISRLACMERCLKTLSREERQLVIAYERGQKSPRIRNRERLAKRLKMSPNALRLRVWRIKQKLEACYRDFRNGLDLPAESPPKTRRKDR